MVRIAFLILWVLLCGASLRVLMLRQSVQTLANVSQHTMFRLTGRTARLFGWLFVTPNLHHTHHHFERPGTDCNYGDVFSVWDRLFGTLVHLPKDATVFGLDTHVGEGANPLRLLGFDAQSNRLAEAVGRRRAARVSGRAGRP
jgi:sterol desaturase/sphingolipid hydroxylase (fatty acid hydroxylase superfamily)